MKYVPLFAAEQVYTCANSLHLVGYRVKHPDLHNFSLELSSFTRTLGPLIEDEYWKSFIRTLKRQRFEWNSAPLPFNYREAESQPNLDSLSKRLINCKQIFPEFATDSQHLFDMFRKLINSRDNPLLEAIKGIPADQSRSVALLVFKSSLIPDTEKILKSTNLGYIDVVNVSQLRDDICYSKLIVIGAASWFLEFEYVFTAPRAREIQLVKYTWLSDRWERESVFPKLSNDSVFTSPNKFVARFFYESENHELDEKITNSATIDPDEILPKVNWAKIKNKAMMNESGGQVAEYDERIEANLVVLEGDMGVIIDSSEESKLNIIDLDRDGNGKVIRIPVRDLEPDMFILLRTGGDRELILEIADSLLGTEANEARDKQKHWKLLLRKTILDTSFYQVIETLKELGSTKASEVNLRNWINYKTIRTEDYHDFQAIMRLIGLRKEEEEYWKTMAIIDSAHQRAGQRIRKLLLNKINNLNLEELRKFGRMDFELPEAETVSLAAFRIKYIDRETIEVPISILNKPFDLEAD